MLTHLSLFSGIGGLDLAAEMAGFCTIGQCEWADYPTKVLEKHWPDVPRWRDIRTLTGESFYEKTGMRTVDVISGGFPCQPFSVAGKRRGKEDDRYLWPEMLRVISELRPAWVVGENVAGIVSMALDTVLADLEGLGYAAQALIIPACAVDAPHRRDRCAVLAYADKARRQKFNAPTVTDESGHPSRSSAENVAHTVGIRLWEDSHQSSYDQKRDDSAHWERRWPELCPAGCSSSNVSNPTHKFRNRAQQCSEPAGRPGLTDGMWWNPEPDVGRVAHGVPSRVDRLKCLGNAVVPPQFYPIFKYIRGIEEAIWSEM